MDLMCSSYAWEGTEKPNIETLRLDDKSEKVFFHVSFFFLSFTTFEKDSRKAWILFDDNIS